MGASEFHVNVGRAGEYKNINDSDATQYTVGYNYNLSKRTKVYGYYTRINNSSEGTYGLGVVRLVEALTLTPSRLVSATILIGLAGSRGCRSWSDNRASASFGM